ncbi:methyl-accepting chemotaxis protein [Ligilactobacillus sp. WILCCON 0076]|uniref:Methyl-accepting chemotaxis protein n=1 Tax=Ligilactobacillus ubinensis TaxID=2876789 RepID=A0A9X2FLR5_9LACO|nr:methyl-accepting chemotaxis protein [Ligilactobacillus ubinensis]MCP0886683.1 methyl-accepting chemotaxis protein [Ligilactobacillus ubinensis]
MATKEISDQELLITYQKIMNLFPQLFKDAISVGLADTEKFISVIPHQEIPMQLGIGDPVPTGGAVHDALVSKKPVIREVGKEVYGVAFQSFAFPIINNEHLIGILVIGKSLKRKHQVLEKAHSLAAALEQTTVAINEIANGAQSLDQTNQELSKSAEMTVRKMEDIKKVVTFIRSVSQRINMLGINAAIAAAHTTSTQSAGFGVIAQEIRKLSTNTANSISEIDSVLSEMNQQVSDFSTNLKSSVNTLGDQSAATEEVLASMEELNEVAKLMEDLANSL